MSKSNPAVVVMESCGLGQVLLHSQYQLDLCLTLAASSHEPHKRKCGLYNRRLASPPRAIDDFSSFSP